MNFITQRHNVPHLPTRSIHSLCEFKSVDKEIYRIHCTALCLFRKFVFIIIVVNLLIIILQIFFNFFLPLIL